MGNENSILEECKLDTDTVEIKDWRLHSGTWSRNNNSKYSNSGHNAMKITLFQKKLSQHSSKRDMEFHENAAKCLKIFRHPCIVRYYDSGQRSDSVFLITEHVTPLSAKLTQFSLLEICAGLHSILQALVFCHDMCKVRHNNFGMESVFVSQDGTWKLSGMEFLCRQADFNEAFLQKNRAFRNEKLIPPEEKEGQFTHLSTHGHANDVYAFGLFAKDLLEMVLKSGGLPGAKEFLDQIKKEVLISDPSLRPHMKSFLNNSFFQNDFIDIFTFLKRLTLKLDSEKEEFFRTLAPRLFRLPEKLIASRLVELLLSRFVLLDCFAKEFFLPHFFRPCRDISLRTEFIEDQVNPILPMSLYQEYVIPQLMYIFDVLDVDIRVILLTYFEYYVDLFPEEVLAKKILPKILLGIRDVNNTLVAISLRALASLVPLLGSEVVIGGKRNQYFTEAKPKESPIKHLDKIGDDIPGLLDIIGTTLASPNLPAIDENRRDSDRRETNHISLQEIIKPPPLEIKQFRLEDSDGSIVVSVKNEEEAWSDWEGPEVDDGKAALESDGTLIKCSTENAIHGPKIDCSEVDPKALRKLSASVGLGEEFDIMAIEIKNTTTNETNFFEGMQPVISNCTFSTTVVDNCQHESDTTDMKSNLFAVDETKQEDPNGWDEDLHWDEDLYSH